MLPLGRSDHAVLVLDFHIVVNDEHVSAQARPNFRKAKIQEVEHPESLVDYPLESESLI